LDITCACFVWVILLQATVRTGGGNEAITVDSVVGGDWYVLLANVKKEILAIQGKCWIKMRSLFIVE